MPLLCQPAYWQEQLTFALADVARVTSERKAGWERELNDAQHYVFAATANLVRVEAEERAWPQWTNSQWMEAADRTRQQIEEARANTELSPEGKVRYIIDLEAVLSFYQGVLNQYLAELMREEI